MVTTQPGESFLDKMIALVEGASRQKTPNEIALTILLAGFTLVFVIVCVTLKPFADYSNTVITIASLISLFVCLIPTTIGGLLSAIGIAGMDRALRANVITKSGKAVETAGDIDTLLLDKTGTITIGNRKATHFHTAPGVNLHDFVETCLLSSLSDETPEGKSIVELGRESGIRMRNLNTTGARMIKFTAETKCSGVDLADGTQIRKGAFDAIRKMVEGEGNEFPKEVEEIISSISSNGGTPLVVCVNKKVTGVIELQDIIKPGIQERFERLRKMGVKFVTNCIVGKTISYDDLHEEGFKGFFAASGAGLPNFMNIPGENLIGVMSSNEYLTRVNLMDAANPESDTPVLQGKKVAVIGGGNTAMDSVRTARRLGAERAMIVYRRSEEEMPARVEEVKHAKEEGVEFMTLHNPIEYIGDERGRVKQMRLQKMELGEPDASGRRRPVAIEGAIDTIDVDEVIVSVGVSPNPLIPRAFSGLEVSKWGTIVVDQDTMRSALPDVYAGGDIVRGGATVILAMGDGRKAAAAMDAGLQGK